MHVPVVSNTVRVESGADTAEELEAAVLRSFPDGRRLLLGQVAKISDSWQRAMVLSRFSGEPAITLYVQRASVNLPANPNNPNRNSNR